MVVTRAHDFPVEIANLFQAFNRCANDHETAVVIEASANMLVAAIHNHVRQRGGDMAVAVALAQKIGDQLGDQLAYQWERPDKASDVIVPSAGN